MSVFEIFSLTGGKGGFTIPEARLGGWIINRVSWPHKKPLFLAQERVWDNSNNTARLPKTPASETGPQRVWQKVDFRGRDAKKRLEFKRNGHSCWRSKHMSRCSFGCSISWRAQKLPNSCLKGGKISQFQNLKDGTSVELIIVPASSIVNRIFLLPAWRQSVSDFSNEESMLWSVGRYLLLLARAAGGWGKGQKR